MKVPKLYRPIHIWQRGFTVSYHPLDYLPYLLQHFNNYRPRNDEVLVWVSRRSKMLLTRQSSSFLSEGDLWVVVHDSVTQHSSPLRLFL